MKGETLIMKNKKLIKWIPLCFLIIIIMIQFVALIKSEILTRQYYSDFKNAYEGNTMLGDMEYFKVLKCNGKTAKVYYVSEDRTMGNVLSFEKIDNNWQETNWDTIWSASGSASDVIWPYWWHFIYGGF